MNATFEGKAAVTFETEWQVLLGQNQIVNWVKSSAEQVSLMRYPGEYKLPGGNVDAAESVGKESLVAVAAPPVPVSPVSPMSLNCLTSLHLPDRGCRQAGTARGVPQADADGAPSVCRKH